MAPCDIVLGILSYALTIQFLLRTEILKEMLFCKGRGKKALQNSSFYNHWRKHTAVRDH